MNQPTDGNSATAEMAVDGGGPFRAEKSAMMELLRAKGIAHVEITYHGFSDNGLIEDITATSVDGNKVPIDTLQVPAGHGANDTLLQAFDDFAWTIVQHYHDGFTMRMAAMEPSSLRCRKTASRSITTTASSISTTLGASCKMGVSLSSRALQRPQVGRRAWGLSCPERLVRRIEADHRRLPPPRAPASRRRHLHAREDRRQGLRVLALSRAETVPPAHVVAFLRQRATENASNRTDPIFTRN